MDGTPPVFGTEGRGFESLQPYQNLTPALLAGIHPGGQLQAGSRVTNRSAMNRMAYRPGLSKAMMPGPISVAPLR